MARLIACCLALVTMWVISAPAAAAPDQDDPTVDILARFAGDDADIRGNQYRSDSAGDEASDVRGKKTSSQPVCTTAAVMSVLGTCNAATTFCPNPQNSNAVWVMIAPVGDPAAEDWVNTGRISCLATRTATPAVTITTEQFRRLRIPAPQIITQPDPAAGHTMVNIDTNFLTEKKSVILPTTVLGQAIRVRATPASYLWTYGDGQQLQTTNPGDLYPNIQTPHVYQQPGNYTVQLQTTFTGEYSVSGGPWQPIQGTATTTSPTTTITAEERRAVLVS